MPDSITCHIEDKGADGAKVVTHDGLAPVWATSMDDAYLLARENGWSVSYVKSRPILDALVAFNADLHAGRPARYGRPS